MEMFQSGMVMVPHKLSFKESLHMCSKMSGEMTSYINQTEFSHILHHLGAPANVNAGECSTALDSDTSELQVYLGGTDDDEEGVFTTWYTRRLIEVERVEVWRSSRITILAVPPLGPQQTLQ